MRKELLLHTCCAPCFSGSFEQIMDNFNPIVFWYNPNIEPVEEHDKRLDTLLRYLVNFPELEIMTKYDYETENKKWLRFIEGLENEPEGGKRCAKCFEFRLRESAKIAAAKGLPFTTTLSISPYKNSAKIFEIGQEMSSENNAKFLEIDFKKNDGYKRSIELSKEFDLYRQKYCGCRYSRK